MRHYRQARNTRFSIEAIARRGSTACHDLTKHRLCDRVLSGLRSTGQSTQIPLHRQQTLQIYPVEMQRP